MSLRRAVAADAAAPEQLLRRPKEWHTGAADQPFDIATFRRRHLSAFTAAGD